MAASVSTSFSTRRRTLKLLGAVPALAATGAFHSLNVQAADLASTTIVLGDQAGGTRALAEAAKVLDGTPYAFRWANFQGAAPLFEAQRAGAVDLAPAGDLPVLAAAVGDPTLKIVATRVGSGAQLGILVAPNSPIRTVADLKGRTVFVSSARGSISQF
jgi:ABC-type nitrate/sulfonate/bicarbonate transport system substrate-binding protein